MCIELLISASPMDQNIQDKQTRRNGWVNQTSRNGTRGVNCLKLEGQNDENALL